VALRPLLDRLAGKAPELDLSSINGCESPGKDIRVPLGGSNRMPNEIKQAF